MNQYHAFFLQTPLFKDISIQEIPRVLCCLNGYIKSFEKGQAIYDYQCSIDYAGIVLEGEVGIVMLNHSGSQHNMQKCLVGELFGEAYACVNTEKLIVQIVANKKSKVVFLRLGNLFNETSVHCPYASRVSVNLLYDIAKKNIQQNRKMEILAQKYIRDKLVLLLSFYKIENNKVLIPYDRQHLANYLGVERSALSRELSKMKADGLIDYNKNEITIISKSLLS